MKRAEEAAAVSLKDLRFRFYELSPVNLRGVINNLFPGFKPERIGTLHADREFSTDLAVFNTRKQLKELGPQVDFYDPELPSRRVYASFWGIALEHHKLGQGEFLEQLLLLHGKFAMNLGLNARVIGHLQRLADPKRSSVEREFALGFLRYYHDYESIFGEPKILEVEGPGTIFSWTLAPYCFDELKEERSPRRSFYLLMSWCQTNSENGVSGLVDTRWNEFALDRDQNHQSHQVARYCSSELVERGYFRVIEDCIPKALDAKLLQAEKADLNDERKRLLTVINRAAEKGVFPDPGVK